MIGGRRTLEILQVAAHAGRSCQIVVIVDVALGALQGRVCASQGESGIVVIERGLRPRRGVVALLARLREARGHVVRIGGALEILQVAVHARRICAGQAVVVIDVALRALQRDMGAREGESRSGVIEVSSGPGSRVVALLASLREARTHVVRIRGALEILQVAVHARRICAGQAVVVVDVALRALHGRMRTGEREASGGVIKGRIVPGGRVVTLLASLGNSRRDVIRVRRPLEILHVTADARGIRAAEVVVAVDVALRALHGGVRPGQGEAGRGVIKGRIVPRARVVTLLTRRRESGLHVIGIGCAVEVLDVTRSAIRSRAHKLAINVALRTTDAYVRTGQRKLRESIVIECGRIPGAGVMASLAASGEAGLRMRRIIGLVEIRHVAPDAGGWGANELVARVAGVAVERCMSSGQGEAGELQVVELRSHPVVHRVALFASRRQMQRDVINPGGFRIYEILLVAGEAHRRKTLELADRGAFVTGITVHGGVRADERKAIQVLVDLLDGYIPALHGMALFAVSAHLALVDIRVAIRALSADISKDRFGVALSTGHAFVHAAQRILRGVVIKLRDRADRLPTAQRVAILARDTKASMRASRIRGRLRLSTGWLPAGKHGKCDCQMK